MAIEQIPDESREKPMFEMFDEIIDKINEIVEWINKQEGE